MALFLLFEGPSGYALFERAEAEEIGSSLEEVQKAVTDVKRFSNLVKLKAFLPFTSAENALEQANAVSEGEMTDTLRNFLEQNLPKGKKSEKFAVGVYDTKLGNAISEGMSIKVKSNETILELLRGIRAHFTRFVRVLKPSDIAQAQLGLGHAYSRSRVKFNVHRVDNMIIQSIALLDQLDKDLNTFAMRVREWYGYHFPELVHCTPDNYTYCRLAQYIKDRHTLTDESLTDLTTIVNDEEKAKQILEASRMSMGQDISEIDLKSVETFASRVASLAEYRKNLHEYLLSKMHSCAPNLSALIGEMVGARLISHAGSLTTLAKYPASTVQILGAEKALFRALKTKGNTPKYGLIFHSSFIGKAGPKNKGRISRYLANKCSIASRIDSFSDVPTSKYGEELKKQVEERLEFYKSGTTPRKNVDVMKKVQDEVVIDGETDAAPPKKKEKKDKKRKAEEEEAVEEEEAPAPKKSKKNKKDKKEKVAAEDDE